MKEYRLIPFRQYFDSEDCIYTLCGGKKRHIKHKKNKVYYDREKNRAYIV